MLAIHTNFYFCSAVCYFLLAIAQAWPSGYGSSSHQLVAVPDLSDYGGITYPHLDVIDLGETQKYVPEKEIKVIRTITITQPYPVKVPVKVPYPVPVEKELPIQVTKGVKVPEPVHVDIVKSVQVHSSDSTEHVQEHHGQWQPFAGDHGESTHFSSDNSGHGDESHYEYQPNYDQFQDNYAVNEDHH